MLFQFLRSWLIAAIGLSLALKTNGQTIHSAQPGNWNLPSTWVEGIIPDSGNSDAIIIDHQVTVGPGDDLTVDNVVINARLIILENGALTILDGPEAFDFTVSGFLEVYGQLVCSNGAVIRGTSATNTIFFDGAVYRDQWTIEGVIPVATWHPNSTFEISGFAANVSLDSAHWGQPFGNVVYDCPSQGNFVDLRGKLTTIQGNFIIRNTNNKIFRIARGHTLSLNIGGDLVIEGPSQVWFGETSDNVNMIIGGDFVYTSTTASYMTVSGTTTFSIDGNFELSTTTGALRFSSSGNAGHTSLSVKGNMLLQEGKLEALNAGRGTIIFNGSGYQQFIRDPAVSIAGNFGYVVEADATVDLGQSVLSNTQSGDLTVRGMLQLGSGDVLGAIQTSSNGNVQVTGQHIFEPGSTIVYNGNVPQYIGNGHPAAQGVTTILNNPAGVTMLSDTHVGGDFQVLTDLFLNGFSVTLEGDLAANENTVHDPGAFRFQGSQLQTIDVNGNTFGDMSCESMNGSDVMLISRLNLSGILTLVSPGTDLISNGWLHLLSQSANDTGNARIAQLATDNAILGSVSVERYINDLPGSTYRYISSPVSSASVADLQDDFPVTGKFADPSIGQGIPSTAPSLYFYDETFGGLQQGWNPYPTSGLAVNNPLLPGRGYAAWILADNAVTWDVSGPLNQGDIDFNITYTDTDNALADGWNLVGNPYPCPIRWDESEGWEKLGVATGIAVRNNAEGNFLYWDGGVGDLENGVIASGQAFWIRTTGPDPALRIKEAAKHTEQGTFYRKKGKGELDFLEIEIASAQLHDKTYLRLRDGARKGFDSFDIPKFDNDRLSLSIEDSLLSLAISAVDMLSCQDSISLKVKSVLTGEVTLSVHQHGMFKNADLVLIDRKTHLQHDITESGYRFTITDPSAELSDRFVLRMISKKPSSGVKLFTPRAVCTEDSVVIELKDAETGLAYSLKDDFGNEIAYILAKTNDEKFILPSGSLQEGQNFFNLHVKSVCGSQQVSEISIVKAEIPLPPETVSSYHCREGVVKLKATARTGYNVNWYDEPGDEIPLATGNEFSTPFLKKNRVFYASVSDSTMCESPKVPVMAKIIQYDDAALSLENGLLKSNHAYGNQWYFNGALIGDAGQYILPGKPGIYRTEILIENCKTAAEYFFHREYDIDKVPGVFAFPNPATNDLWITMPDDTQLADIISATGISVIHLTDGSQSTEERLHLNISKFPRGIYFIEMRQNGHRLTTRFLKQ